MQGRCIADWLRIPKERRRIWKAFSGVGKTKPWTGYGKVSSTSHLVNSVSQFHCLPLSSRINELGRKEERENLKPLTDGTRERLFLIWSWTSTTRTILSSSSLFHLSFPISSFRVNKGTRLTSFLSSPACKKDEWSSSFLEPMDWFLNSKLMNLISLLSFTVSGFRSFAGLRIPFP